MKLNLVNLIFTLAFWISANGVAFATVDEAYDHAMNAAVPYVEKDYVVREDYWNGEVVPGQKLAVRHQMFRGNDYVFWLGTAHEGVKLDLKIYDSEGNEVQLDRKVAPYTNTVRVSPQRTGTFMVVFSLEHSTLKNLQWALAYGYR